MDLSKRTLKIALAATVFAAGFVPSITGQADKICINSPEANQIGSSFGLAAGEFSAARPGRTVRPDVDSEKAISVNKNVYVSFCVTGAPVKINGWKRSEVRAFVKGRADIAFKVREKSRYDKKPVWLELFAGERPSGTERIDSCLSGDSVELDVPYGASINITGTSGESSVEIDSVKKAKIDIASGDLALSRVGEGIDAQTDVGGVTVRKSSGKMYLKTTAGNIIAFETEANEIGDYLKAKTNSGAITMQSIGQKEVNASSISGSISFVGETKEYGDYSFTTTNGRITLAFPVDSSFNLKAAYGGSFSSDLPLNNVFKNAMPSAVYLTGKVGQGIGATVSMRSYSGTIKILGIEKESAPKAIP